NNTAESKQASAGWGGDRYALYESGKSGEIFVAQLTAWDTPDDAREFFVAYARRTSKRYPGAKESAVGERIIWETATGRVAMELRGSRVAILEGIPAKKNVNTLLNMMR
ncbi:MAG TPA: hypothetical protein VFU83_09010, partial [Pyrinomonadaceae bacterium]|nr:hypothetical protein [Pyrinomonadaceae bacterium]